MILGLILGIGISMYFFREIYKAYTHEPSLEEMIKEGNKIIN